MNSYISLDEISVRFALIVINVFAEKFKTIVRIEFCKIWIFSLFDYRSILTLSIAVTSVFLNNLLQLFIPKNSKIAPWLHTLNETASIYWLEMLYCLENCSVLQEKNTLNITLHINDLSNNCFDLNYNNKINMLFNVDGMFVMFMQCSHRNES